MAEDLRDRLARALCERIPGPIPWENVITFDTLRECRDRHYAEADAVLAVLLADPGNLPERTADALNSHEWEPAQRHTAHRTHNYHGACAVCQEDLPRIAEVALSVRWEQAAQLAAENAQLRRRAEHAEGEHQVTRERLDQARRERDLAVAHDRQPYPTAWAYEQACKALEDHRQRADHAEASERRVRAIRDDWWKRPGWTEAGDALDAALDGGE